MPGAERVVRPHNYRHSGESRNPEGPGIGVQSETPSVNPFKVPLVHQGEACEACRGCPGRMGGTHSPLTKSQTKNILIDIRAAPRPTHPMTENSKGNLTRPIYPMPQFVEDSLIENGLLPDYNARPAYQQNDYIGWITGAKRPETQLKRLNQMLEELRTGGIYMRMKHPPSRRS